MRFLSLLFLLPFLNFAQDYNVRGFISNEKTGEAISNEKVTLLSKDSTLVAGALTDVNGLFSIPKLNKEEYIIKLSVAGYKKIYIPVNFSTDKKTN